MIRQPRESTTEVMSSGAGRPLVAASYRGVRHATARTVNEMTRAAVAPAIASSGEIGRSLAPPSPWASVMPSFAPQRTSSWTITLSSVVRLDLDGPGLVDALDRHGGLALGVLQLLLGIGVDVDLAGCVGGDLELDVLAARDLDPVAVRRHRSPSKVTSMTLGSVLSEAGSSSLTAC